MASSPMKKEIFDRDKVALWFFMGTLVLGLILILVLLLKNYLT
ncbi:hypothetical protein [Flavilitoribacter nigricans]|nr:hypothetical protein [Flavilitoribacter nigricans]